MSKKHPLRQAASNFRLHLQYAGLSNKHTLPQNIRNTWQIACGRLSSQPQLRLRYSNKFAYRFKYLHVGLTQLAGQGAIDYHFALDKSLGRKTAVIEYQPSKDELIIAVIDASDRHWQLGDPWLDFNTVFGSAPRILFKLEYGLQEIHEKSAGRHDLTLPPIGYLYHQVLDGGYWPINQQFLDAKWVASQQQINGSTLDLFAAYGLQADDIIPDERHGGSEFSERVAFEALSRRIAQETDFKILVRMILYSQHHKHIDLGVLPEHIKHHLHSEGFPFDEYVRHTLNAKLNYVPKNSWHAVTPDLTAHRTYRLLELLALGCVCLSSPAQLHIPFEPGEHYIAMRSDLADAKQVIEHAISNPQKLHYIRKNALTLYHEHLSPIAIARHYVDQLHKLHTGEKSKVAWEVTQ